MKMRHTEFVKVHQTSDNNSFFVLKDEVVLNEDRDEIPLNLADLDYDHIIKNEFASDDDDFNDLDIESELSEYNESPKKTNEGRKNKRKALTPQRAIQSENSQSCSNENSSESSQDAAIHLNHSIAEQILLNDISDSEIPEGEDLLRDIDEENIFKGIEAETDGEKLDEELLDNVKEEWRAHWGIKCNMCEKIFSYKSEYDVHYRNSYNTAPVYTCSFCNKTVEKYSTFRSHCYRHITEGRYKCRECPKGFSLKSLLHVHIVAKHTRAKPYMCEECGKSFVTKPGLTLHLKKHKNEVKEAYPCVVCGKVLHTRGGLTSHMNVHRLGRRFMCDVCGKTFTQKVNMQQHVKQHTGDKPHACDKCGKTFAEKSHLARHHSFHSEQRPFKCEVCQKMYKTERCLKVHSLVHAKERPYICTTCSKGFLSSTKLKQHYNIHTGERPYACKYCERKFTNYPNWLKHTRRRHNVDHKTGEDLPPKTTKAKPAKPGVLNIPQNPIRIPSSIHNTPLPIIDQLSSPDIVPTLKMEIFKTDTPTIPLIIPDTELCPEATISDLPAIDQSDLLSHDTLISDFALSKTEEMLLQQGLFNFPINDDKFLLQQQVDLFAASGHLPSPFFQMQLPSNQPGHSQLLLNDFVPMQFIQHTLPCD